MAEHGLAQPVPIGVGVEKELPLYKVPYPLPEVLPQAAELGRRAPGRGIGLGGEGPDLRLQRALAKGIHDAPRIKPFLRKHLDAGDVDRFPGLAHGQGKGGSIALLELLAEGRLGVLHRSRAGVAEGVGTVVAWGTIASRVPARGIAFTTFRALALGLAIAAPALAFAAFPFAARVALIALPVGSVGRCLGEFLEAKEGVKARIKGQLLFCRFRQHEGQAFLQLLPVLHTHAVHGAEGIKRFRRGDAHLRHAKGADEALERGVHARRFCGPSREGLGVPASAPRCRPGTSG